MTLYNGLRTRYTTDQSLSSMTGREIGELFYQYVYLINKRSRREVRNIGEVIVPAVVRHDVVTIRSLGALVLQHVLEVFHRMGDGRHYLLFAKVNNLYNTSHLTQRVVFLFLRAALDDVCHIGEGERRGKQQCFAREAAPARLSM